jgi:leucyl/phenylalanyl-tRNA--protein transferase
LPKILKETVNGNLITNDMIEGIAICMNWELLNPLLYKTTLVGGLYGIDLGHVFVVKACFLKFQNASKVAFIFTWLII